MSTAGALSKKPTRSVVEKFNSEFCQQLMNRVHPLIEWVTGIDSIYLIFINLVDRSNLTSLNNGELVYAGMSAQKKLLERNFSIKFPNLLHVNTGEPVWEYFDNASLPKNDAIASSANAKLIADNAPVLEGIKVNKLKEDYFINFLNRGKFDKEPHGYEYSILDFIFDIEQDCFITLPLYQFSHYDGSIHIVFKQEDREPFEDEKILKHLIRQFSLEYESLLLDWDLVGDNAEKLSMVEADLRYLASDEFQEECQRVQILKELGYDRYYKNSVPYLLERVRQNDTVPNRFKNEHRKRAIIAILIDSYAHNISAHSLTVLKWWFQQRAGTDQELRKEIQTIADDPTFQEWGVQLREYLSRRFPDFYTSEQIEQGIQADLARWMLIVERRKQNGPFLPVRDQFLPLAKELFPLFKFLLEKGAFWSGITRDRQFGGDIRSLYDILWHDFINNPLYLGTIAYSEGITKLNIHFRFYSGRQYMGDRFDFQRIYQIEKSEDSQEYLDGLFATINVGDEEDTGFKHNYVKPGDRHELLAKKLKSCQIFLPGGVVGKHALFTLLENEIRNVKHYLSEDLKDMRQNGLNLYIGIRPGTLSGVDRVYKVEGQQLFKIGIWLDHKSKLYNNDEHLLAKRLKNLMGDIILPGTNQARLGGNYQDKICAAMLFNNTFTSVQNRTSQRDQHYYPWIRSAYSLGSSNGDSEKDFEVNGRNLKEAEEILLKGTIHKTKGYFKKHFHLWQGKPLFRLQNVNQLEEENIARFQIVLIDNSELLPTVREHGVIRVLDNDLDEASFERAYHQWLQKWLKDEECHIQIIRGNSEVGHIFLGDDGAAYKTQKEYPLLSPEQQNIYNDYARFKLEFTHGGIADESEKNALKVRSHGILAQYFFQNLESINDFSKASLPQLKLFELVETIQTKICIFDNRVSERLSESKRQYLNKQLKCGIYPETIEHWQACKQEGWQNYHFIVMHLSFIESMQDSTGKKYSEARITDFLNDNVADLLGPNCIFVVTTGRGREEWWRNIQNNDYYRAHTTFRPVEMLIEAVELGSMKADDIDIKYNLVKVLFGS